MTNRIKCNYNILDRDVSCQHKIKKIKIPSRVTLHNHDGFEIILFLSGDVSLLVESDEKKLAYGDLVFINAYDLHGLKLTDALNYERIVINIRENYLKSLGDEDTDLTACFRSTQTKKMNVINLDENEIPNFIAVAEKLENAIYKSPFGSNVLKKAYLSELMVMCNRYVNSAPPVYALQSSATPEIVTKAFEYIENNLSSDLSVDKIAKELNHNSDYLSRTFKKATGSSLKSYITAKKISLVQQYLRQGYSPYDACFMTGYNNYSSFSRQFSDHVGISPKQYQLMNGHPMA